ncbi:Glutamate/acetylglutamate kinase [Sesbania bispinosa]|nr:Glutamate/acetylglutamate kinase [Sesbania bispinosa]
MLGGAAKSITNWCSPLPFISRTETKRKSKPTNLTLPSSGCRCSSVSTFQVPPSTITESLTPGQFRVDILSESLPFIQKFRGKTIVVKYGGAAMKSPELQSSVINDLVLLSCVGLRPVMVHGGGPEINNWLGRLNIQAVFRDGLRVTDAETMEIAGATAVGLSGMDGRLLTARPSPKAADLGFVGEVSRVDPTVLRSLIDSSHIPVVTSVAADEFGQPYNINADTVAGELAAALGAEKLILLTDVAGILEDRNDPNSLVKKIDIKGVKMMMEDGKVGGGMIPKVNCCVRSLAQGVTTASIIDGRVPHSLLLEILTDEVKHLLSEQYETESMTVDSINILTPTVILNFVTSVSSLSDIRGTSLLESLSVEGNIFYAVGFVF